LRNLQIIIKGCIANDAKCQRLLYEQYYGYAFKIAFRYIYNYERVADVVNDGFVKLFKNIASFTGTGESDIQPRLMGWIKKIVVNTAIDELRKNKLMLNISNIPEEMWSEPRDGNNSDDLVLYKELVCLIKKLPASCRAVFNMHVMDGFSHKEIAEHLNISVGTSKSNLSKARAWLQKAISKADVYADV
jgi:RNA polymerase sigma-70 factor (ECF subfamily)